MSLTLYSGPLSLFTAKVRIALAEKSLAYEKISVAWSLKDRYEPHHPEVERLNPRGQVPVLIDNDVSLYDSTVILEYLEDRYPEPALYPRDAATRARCRQLEAAADEVVFPHVWAVIEESLYPAGAEGRDPARAEAAQAGLQAQFAELDRQLTGDYLCGDFSVADIGTFIMVHAAAGLGAPPAPSFGRLEAWRKRTGERPSVAAEVAGMTASLGAAFAAR